LAVRQAETEAAANQRLTRGDLTDPELRPLVNKIAKSAYTQAVSKMAEKAGVSDLIMMAAIGSLSGEPVPPAQRAAVWDLLANAATQMTADHPTDEQAS
jgi:ABC-type lipoprotein export system ATPase subunit